MELNIEKIFQKIEPEKKKLAEYIIILMQAYNNDGYILEPELKYLYKEFKKLLEENKDKSKILIK
jgi:type I restriction-modification system DNA methylase subunit